MANPEECKHIAKMLVEAYMLVGNSDYIVCDVADNEREMTKAELSVLRDYLPAVKIALGDVITSLVAHTLTGVE